MNLKVRGKGTHISLDKSDFVASGGEGSVYRKGDTAYKIYTDSYKMIPIEKIDELAVLTMPNIIRPQDVLLDSKSRPVGYSMRYLKDTYALCQLFSRAFKERMGVKNKDTLAIVKGLQNIVSHCHEKGVLIVDLNEMNFLVDDNFSEVYGIDCDSYQTKTYPATAIMDSIRDRHTKVFSQGTDWFSFSVLAFQMFIGIHPYKGKHPTIKNIDDRMLQNVSVLNKEVSIPNACYPLTVIPDAYKAWFKAVLEEGKRLAPPNNAQDSVVIIKKAKIVGSNNFIIKKLMSLGSLINKIDSNSKTILAESGIFGQDGRLMSSVLMGRTPAFGGTPDGIAIAIMISGGMIVMRDLTHGVTIPVSVSADAVTSGSGDVYFKSGDRVYSFDFFDSAGKVHAAPVLAFQVMENATSMFDGVVFQDAVGTCYATLLNPNKTCDQIHIKELDGRKIVDAKYERNVLIVVSSGKGQYEKHIIRFAADHRSYDHRSDKEVGPSSVNFTVLPNGVCVYINDREELELFSSSPTSTSSKVFDDPVITGEMRLSRIGTQVVFSTGEDIYSISVK